MTSPTWESTTVTDFGSDVTTHAANMPATVNSGDLLIAAAAFDATATITTPSGWTLMVAGAETGVMVSGLYTKVAAGSEGGTTVDFATSAAQRGSVHVFRVTAWEGSLGGLRVVAYGAGVRAIGLALGASHDWLWIAAQYKSAVAAWSTGGGTPSGYGNDNRTNASEDSTASASIASGTKTATAASEEVAPVWLAATGEAFLIGVLPSSGTSVSVAPAAAAITMTGATPTVLTPVAMGPAATAITITTGSPEAGTSQTLGPAGTAIVITTGTPTVGAGQTVTPAGASITITTSTPVVGTSQTLGPAGASITMTPGTPFAGPSVLLTPPGDVLTISTGTPVVTSVVGVVVFGAGPKLGYIIDRPSISYDGTGLVNRIIPFGVDSDGGDLTLEHAIPSFLPFAIQRGTAADGSSYWYIEDAASIAKYGLYESRVYRSDVKSPYRAPSTEGTTAVEPAPTAATALGHLAILVNPAEADGFTIGTRTYRWTATPSAPLDIPLGADLYSTLRNTWAAIKGLDGLNYTNPDVRASFVPGGIQFAFKSFGSTGNDIVTTSGTAAATFDSATLTGGQWATLTANVLYAISVNDLLRGRSETLAVRVSIANGADVWALPGDRVKFKFAGWAKTQEGDDLGLGRFTWVEIDEWMLVVERHDRSDPSGVRQVEFVLACPMLQYAIPVLPEWVDPVALPVPANTGNTPPGVDPGFGDAGDGYDFPADDPPGEWNPADTSLADIINSLLDNVGQPFGPCCPDTFNDVSSGDGLLPPTPELMWTIAQTTNSTTGPLAGDPTRANWAPADDSVVLLFAFNFDGGDPSIATNEDCSAEELFRWDFDLTLEHFYCASWVISKTGANPEWATTSALLDNAEHVTRATANQIIPGIHVSVGDESTSAQGIPAPGSPGTITIGAESMVDSEDDLDAVFSFFMLQAWAEGEAGGHAEFNFDGNLVATLPGVGTGWYGNVGPTAIPSTASVTQVYGGLGGPYLQGMMVVATSVRLQLFNPEGT